MKRMNRIVLFTLTLLVTACATTQIEESWTLPGYQPPPAAQQKVLVVALAAKETTRKAFESAFVQALEAKGIMAIPSSQWLADSTTVNRDSLAPIVIENKVTSVLVGSLRGIEKLETYQPPQQIGPSDNLYRNFDTYMVYSSSGEHEPGTYEAINEYLLETNLFNVATEKLSWSVKTRTTQQTSLEEGVNSIVSAVLKQAEKDKIF